MNDEKLKLLAKKIVAFAPDIRSKFAAPKRLEGPHQLAPHQFSCLAVIHKSGKISMKELGARIGVSKQQLTRIVDVLEDAGLVRRFTEPENRRLLYAEMTAKGLELSKISEHAVFERTKQCFGCLSDEDIDRLIASISDITEIFAKIPAESVQP